MSDTAVFPIQADASAEEGLATHADVVARLGISALAGALGVSVKKVDGWKTRSSIPGPWFRPVEIAAGRLGHPMVTVDLLADLASARVLPAGAAAHPPDEGLAAADPPS